MKVPEIRNDSILDNLIEGFQVISFDWKYLYLNQAVIRQSKFSRKEDLLGFTMMEKFPGIEKTEMFTVLNKCMTERVPWNFENKFTYPDGTTAWFELRIQPVPEGVFILSIDISEKKKAEEEKKKQIRQLEEMIFMASHKVRQPVTHIIGVSNLLDSFSGSQEDLKKLAGYMKDSALTLDITLKELTHFIYEINMKVKTQEI